MLRRHCDICDKAATPTEPLMEGRYEPMVGITAEPFREVRMRIEFQAESGEYHEFKALEICNGCADRMLHVFKEEGK